MIKAVMKSKLKPGVKEDYLKLIAELVQATRKEEGCIAYALYEDINDPLTLTIIEEWRDQEAIDLHSNTEHFLRIVPELRKMRESGELNFYKEVIG